MKTPASNRPLRIVIGMAGLQLGGCQINALDLAMTLRRRGHDVMVFAVEDDPVVSVLPLASQRNIDIRVLPACGNALSQSRHVRKVIKDHDADITHVFGWLAWATAIASFGTRSAVAVTNWNMEDFPGLPPFTPVLVATEALRESGSRGRPSPVWLHEPPVDLETDICPPDQAAAFRAQHGIAPDELLAVIVSRLDRTMKAPGIRNTMLALERLGAERPRLVIVGGGDAEGELRQLAQEVNDRTGGPPIVLTGPKNDPRPAYAAADIVLAMGGAAHRALAFGKPLVVLGDEGFSRPFDEASRAWFIRHGFYGVGGVDDPVGTLANHLSGMLPEETRKRLGLLGRSLAEERFGLVASAARLEEIYGQTIRLRTGPRSWFDLAYTVCRDSARSVRHSLRLAPPRPETP